MSIKVDSGMPYAMPWPHRSHHFASSHVGYAGGAVLPGPVSFARSTSGSIGGISSVCSTEYNASSPSLLQQHQQGMGFGHVDLFQQQQQQHVYGGGQVAERHLVKAATLLERDSATDTIDVVSLVDSASLAVTHAVQIADAAGQLYCTDHRVSTASWLKVISIAKDSVSYNVLLMMTSNGVVLKAVKSILPGEPLLMWFTDNILAMLDMAPLNHINAIDDQGKYVCRSCDQAFDYPNPLRVHLVLDCGRLNSEHLWTRLAQRLGGLLQPPRSAPWAIPSYPQQHPRAYSTGVLSNSPGSDFQLSPAAAAACYAQLAALGAAMAASSGGSVCSSPASSCSSQASSSPPSSLSCSPPASHLQLPSCIYAGSTNSTSNVQHATETIASNLGKVKSGHRCIYCGKVYSRKYGLKIHIRTHTGYKPLKCKYCSRPFGDPSNLNKHMRLHAQAESPYRCALCGKDLVRRRDLERHLRSRHQINIGSADAAGLLVQHHQVSGYESADSDIDVVGCDDLQHQHQPW
ncbi:hypothetical protein QAD02_006977 [Eretmocerus hayati]|uniref:Uncharacterized protein n=1 Tax=Eretmocerus hayati TaxID=131215 RepID=A0ACC2N2C0_9HYME|nr:hypothetical protein QAD02_006977 [Eretmocerus hayati]